MITPALRRSFRFFLAHGGGIVGQHAQSALALARAEQWAKDSGVAFDVRDDDERAYCHCGDPTCKYREPDASESPKRWNTSNYREWDTVGVMAVRPCEDHGTDCPHAEHLGSLWGIMDPSPEYLRVVKAELALEAMLA